MLCNIFYGCYGDLVLFIDGFKKLQINMDKTHSYDQLSTNPEDDQRNGRKFLG